MVLAAMFASYNVLILSVDQLLVGGVPSLLSHDADVDIQVCP